MSCPFFAGAWKAPLPHLPAPLLRYSSNVFFFRSKW
jgi:hypothetical protein